MGKKRVNYDPNVGMSRECVSCVTPRRKYTAGLRVNEEDTVQMCKSCLYALGAITHEGHHLSITDTLFKRIACKQFNFPGSVPKVEHNDGCVPREFMT